MEKRIQEKNKKRSERFESFLKQSIEQKEQEQSELNRLLDKVMKAEMEEAEKQRLDDIEKEKTKAITKVTEDINQKYKEKGYKTAEQIAEENDYREMLKRLNGR
ncbi:hypothetical protein [Vagococcus xieshaowenii]|uniref:Uncharacterized protein n=1 Tax=Vagococcus xieshaowenii TaxID=2562451 RepID=A0AAJ5JL68_9ENTE|nr:hypothetical protein [Vagococcus xieshaowenii]QCA29157.1 hypothetical protein E4Z98_07455 [Vagococcus xieshaowenii]TFZ40865.1 hypothetical protein E4031_05635 [Vagococcus xieshaowenii]